MQIKNIKIQQSTSLLDKDKLLQSIFQISTLLGTSLNLEAILKTILDEAVDAIGFDRGIIRLFDETKQYLETKVVKNYPPDEEATSNILEYLRTRLLFHQCCSKAANRCFLKMQAMIHDLHPQICR